MLVPLTILDGGLVYQLLRASALDHSRQVADGDLQGEVHRRQHDGEEDIPARQGGDEETASGGFDQFPRGGGRARVGGVCVHEGQVPVGARQAAEGENHGDENDDEDHVGAEGADEEDETDYAWSVEFSSNTGEDTSRWVLSVFAYP